LAVITDNINMDADSTWATIESTQDYFAFGLEMEGRSYVADRGDGDKSYRFGFQGQEKNDETGTIHFKFREHDPKIGRFWSTDPLQKNILIGVHMRFLVIV
jgi:RHS repeat-associated protein